MRRVTVLLVAIVLLFSLNGCSESFRSTFSLFGGNVEKSGKKEYRFNSKEERWRFVPNCDGEILFFSSDPKVASVDKEGVVSPEGKGRAIITAASTDGNYIESAEVFVDMEERLIKGVWVSTVWNIDFPSRSGLTEQEIKKEADEIVENCSRWGLNTIFLQVRPLSDAIYFSEIFPSSSFVVEKQGEKLPFDILEYFIEKAHSENIELHAWINPYRISFSSVYGTDFSAFAKKNPAAQHPEYTLTADGGLFYNPAIPEVRTLICDGVAELVENYDIDGIHFDDYFYPYSKDYDDSESYRLYGRGKDLEGWRRDNVTKLIKSVGERIKAIRSDCLFGVSPSGIWASAENIEGGTNGLKNTSESFFDSYADSKKWVESGYLDYIAPQIYWERDNSAAPFEKIADWWQTLCSKNSVDLYIGIAAYKAGTEEKYKNPQEMDSQIEYAKKLSAAGVVFFSYSSLLNDYGSIISTIKDGL